MVKTTIMNSKNIVTIAIIIVVAALIVAVFVFFGGPKSSISGGLQTVAPLSAQESNALSREFLLALSSLNSLELKSSFFDDKAFKLLIDYSKDIKDEGVGRDNPFLPISEGVTPVAQSIKSVPPIVSEPVKSSVVKPSGSTTSTPTATVTATSTSKKVLIKPSGTSTTSAF